MADITKGKAIKIKKIDRFKLLTRDMDKFNLTRKYRF
tara:strand:- start:87 stop:197 length:111 start_codon:yes stop_codon:yes gene_type:complete